MLVLRVNSMNDISYGAGQGEVIEPHLYLVKNRIKRFFTENELLELFDGWDICYMEEYTSHRFKKGKVVWEMCCKKVSDKNEF